jgi:hypothetical protein
MGRNYWCRYGKLKSFRRICFYNGFSCRHSRADISPRHSREGGNPETYFPVRSAAFLYFAALWAEVNALDSRLRGNDEGFNMRLVKAKDREET